MHWVRIKLVAILKYITAKQRNSSKLGCLKVNFINLDELALVLHLLTADYVLVDLPDLCKESIPETHCSCLST